MKNLILAVSISIIFCSQVWADCGWVLWHQIEVTRSMDSATGWTVDDAFEDFKGCKKGADKASQRYKSERLELNAGFDLVRDQKDSVNTTTLKWLCLPAGTNPMIYTKNWSQKVLNEKETERVDSK